MPLTSTNKTTAYLPRPAVDEWGIYDPDQAGLSAVFDRIESRAVPPTRADAQAIAKSMREANALIATDKT